RWCTLARLDSNRCTAADGAVTSVDRSKCLIAKRNEGHEEGRRTTVARLKRVAGGHHHARVRVAGGECDGALVVRVDVAKAVHRYHGNVEGHARDETALPRHRGRPPDNRNHGGRIVWVPPPLSEPPGQRRKEVNPLCFFPSRGFRYTPPRVPLARGFRCG